MGKQNRSETSCETVEVSKLSDLHISKLCTYGTVAIQITEYQYRTNTMIQVYLRIVHSCTSTETLSHNPETTLHGKEIGKRQNN